MKKSVFILLFFISAHFFLKAQDTIYYNTSNVNVDTINYTYIFPEVMNPNICFDQGYNDPIMDNVLEGSEVSRLVCDIKPLKAVAQGFMFEDTYVVDGILARIGFLGRLDTSVTDLNFKMGLLDEQYNVIYEKDIVFDVSSINSTMGDPVFTRIPFDSTLTLNDFVYIFIEQPDNACVGGTYWNTNPPLYEDDSATLFLTALTEEPLGDFFTEEFCVSCNVKYEPLFKWYGESNWINLNSLRCDLNFWYGYGYVKDGIPIIGLYYPPIGLAFYYANNNSGDSGLSEMNISHLVSLSSNPAKDIVTIQSSFKVKEIEIHNALGQVVLRKEGSQNIETIDVSNLQSGAYIVRIKTQRGFANKKILIE